VACSASIAQSGDLMALSSITEPNSDRAPRDAVGQNEVHRVSIKAQRRFYSLP